MTAFHRLARTAPAYRWWRPLATIVLFLVSYAVIMFAAIAVSAIWMVAGGPGGESIDAALRSPGDLHAPLAQIVMLTFIVLFIPAALIAARFGAGQPPGTLISVAGRIRWRLLGLAVGLAAPLVLLAHTLGTAFFADGGFGLLRFGAQFPLLLAIAVLIVPLQAFAEELVFRGLLPQIIGSWLRNPLWAYLLTIPLFVAGHLYSWPGLIDIAVFAAAAGLLTHRSGGLELAIGLHIVGNSSIFVLGALGLADLNAVDVGPGTVAVSITTTVVFTAAALHFSPPFLQRSQESQAGATDHRARCAGAGSQIPAGEQTETAAETPSHTAGAQG
ncbi:CPBP family intramembrane glutamic endopeptidase [Brevibacterium luteolum]|uniref:CPBP family intramembrane glutamic endopeptidase n=1 Tax=Brevibacterium luteolum TaxID=199591 RepID=UPI00223BE8EE|nr:type II CAAX endopeptidase family protein [Brevibacterium luteolum]MCT1657327.1 CPBP family intramembrane metalloprotease [Brevibacterium luteolum]MCT1830556.1 CPBP family intramembrane metalloprotease [Brevibacterium luteolum]MCT1873869.1 CPBP family intramembrane metalloprotease [Brevibacterium luteolum]MCT1891176.1 CPBP family intramembrane metalloprotease [Brevibacterium luteolum]MCT1893793.1 CPBP family intramembrane metalloprotease [Brevibacterium luteolum]